MVGGGGDSQEAGGAEFMPHVRGKGVGGVGGVGEGFGDLAAGEVLDGGAEFVEVGAGGWGEVGGVFGFGGREADAGVEEEGGGGAMGGGFEGVAGERSEGSSGEGWWRHGFCGVVGCGMYLRSERG